MVGTKMTLQIGAEVFALLLANQRELFETYVPSPELIYEPDLNFYAKESRHHGHPLNPRGQK